MTQDLSSKLAAGTRKAKQKTPDDSATPAQAQTKAADKPATLRVEPQTPREILDDPWKNLHPSRIWPD